MKNTRRNFAIEYKPRRRRRAPKSKSIWGDIDIKSVVRNLQVEAQVPVQTSADCRPCNETSFSEQEQHLKLLAPPAEHETNILASKETRMNNGKNVTAAIVTPEVTTDKRKPRAARRAQPEIVSAELGAGASAAVDKPKRVRRGRSYLGVGSAKRVPAKREPKTALAYTASPAEAAVDEFVDLLQLEAENQKLRKLLAEKLRSENADLRKRLNLA